jgi:hypothetical protein
MAATMSALRVKAPVAAARLSSRNNTACSPVLPKAASAPGMTRLVSLVCEAQQGSKSAAAKAMQAVRYASLYAESFCAFMGRRARDKCAEMNAAGLGQFSGVRSAMGTRGGSRRARTVVKACMVAAEGRQCRARGTAGGGVG